ncbi:MAG: hypothetical protein CMJ51_06385 [Planctomycetaceae bacterium]|nr:hypothetical protein [Planctomycetaceae bacterium]
MKFVWAIIAGLLLAAAVLLARGESRPTGVRSSSGPVIAPVPAKPRTPTTGRAASSSTDSNSDASDDRIDATSWVLTDADTLPELARRRYGDERLWRRIVDANPLLAAGELELGDRILLPDLADIPEPVIDAASLVADLDQGRGERPTDPEAEPTPSIEVPPGTPSLTLGLDREIPEATVEPGKLFKVDDAIVADGDFTIRGSGTQEDPYRVSWELLASAAEGYRPSLGERQMPQRVAALDGQWIRIDGYVAFPLGGADTSELLVMLNQWDGCCIGIPPTPYDALEVSLSEAIPPAQRHSINYGTLTGRLLVSPYLVENWLVGLYLMDDASVRFEL